jgi:hypothetical protein
MVMLSLLLVFALFVIWYGGAGKPLDAHDLEQCRRSLDTSGADPHSIQEVLSLLKNDDGKEFVMVNLVRHRPSALYPSGYQFSDSAREADQRYGRAIIWPLIRRASLPVFIGKRSGSFIDPLGADQWHYVAMVRYRSRRDFFSFAMATQKSNIFVHKWAAIEKTHVFPVKPFVSLIWIRTIVALLLALVGWAITRATL